MEACAAVYHWPLPQLYDLDLEDLELWGELAEARLKHPVCTCPWS